MIGIPLALAVFSYGEWATHKYLLHGVGRNKHSYFAVHWHEHHRAVRKHGGYDPDYEGPLWSTKTQAGEAMGLALVGLAHLPLLPVAPFYTLTTWYCLHRYRRDHRRAHLDPAWARAHLPWHFDHHMGDQDKNWGVTFGWFDALVGTRERFVEDPEARARSEARARDAARQKRPRKRFLDVMREIGREVRRETRRAA